MTPEKILKYAEKYCNHVQINIDSNREKSLSIKNNCITSFKETESQMCSAKVIIDGKEGFAYGNHISLDIIKKAIKIAKLNSRKEYFYGLPKKQDYVNINNYSKIIEELDEDIIVDESKKLINEVVRDNVILSSGGVELNIETNQILNSNGINVIEKATSYDIGISTVLKKGGKISSWFDDKSSNKFFKADNWGNQVREKTLFYLDAKKLKIKPKKITLTTEVFSELLNYSFLSNFNGKNIEKHKSIFCDKRNKLVLGNNISIFDNNLKGLNSSRFDDEGTKGQNTCIVKKGILNNFIYDFDTAKHAHTESTGNSSGGRIGFSNVIINGPKESDDEGLIIESIMGAHTGNALTTDFSVKVEHAIYNGKPIKDIMISGKMIDVMNSIISMSKKREQKGNLISGNVTSDNINLII